MKLFRKALSLVLVASMLLGACAMVFADEVLTVTTTADTATVDVATAKAGFTDAASIVNKEAVTVLSSIRVIDGYTNGSFGPSYTIKRGQATAFICRMLLGRDAADALEVGSTTFSDVESGYAFEKYISYCVDNGIVGGYADGTFKAGNTLSTAAFTKMLLTALGYSSEKEGFTGDGWQANAQKIAEELGLYNGVSSSLTAGITRQEAAAMCLNALAAKTVSYVGDTLKQNTKTLAEEKYPTLKSAASEESVLGRPAEVWTLDGVEIYNGACAAKATFNGAVTTGKLAAAAGEVSSVVVYLDGEKVSEVVADYIAADGTATVPGTGAGTVTELYVEDGAATVVIYNLYLATATADYADGVVKATSSVGELEIADTALSAVKKGGYLVVAYDKALGKVASAAVAATKKGEAKSNSEASVKIGGTTYAYSVNFSGEKQTIEDKSTVTVVLDSANNILAITNVTAPKAAYDYNWIFLAYYYGEYGNNKVMSVNGKSQTVKEYKCCAMNGEWKTIYAENDNIFWYVGTYTNMKYDSSGKVVMSADRCDKTTNDFLAFITKDNYISIASDKIVVNDTYDKSGHETGEKTYNLAKGCKVWYFYGGYSDYFQEITLEQMPTYTAYYESTGGNYLYCTYDENGLINNLMMYGY